MIIHLMTKHVGFFVSLLSLWILTFMRLSSLWGIVNDDGDEQLTLQDLRDEGRVTSQQHTCCINLSAPYISLEQAEAGLNKLVNKQHTSSLILRVKLLQVRYTLYNQKPDASEVRSIRRKIRFGYNRRLARKIRNVLKYMGM